MHPKLAVDERLSAVLPPGSLYAVGGRVRDELRGVGTPAKDLDYVVTGIELPELTERLNRLGRVDLVGAAFAVLKVTFDGTTVDIALPRRERSIGQGHREFAVQSGADVPLADDLGRRDFRMNMIARALPSGDIIDPYRGADDIANRRIDIVASSTFAEDPLRMLRAAQFAARFEYDPTPATLEAMTQAAPLVETVSGERVYEEFLKLFGPSRRPSIGLELLRFTGVLRHLWPELLEGVGVEQNEWHAYDVWHHNLATLDAIAPGDAVLRIAALLHDVGKPRTKDGPHFYRHEHVGAEMAREMLQRFRFPGEAVETVEHLVRQHMYAADPEMTDAALRRSIRRIGVGRLHAQFALRHADIAGSGLPKRDDSNERFELRVWKEIARKPAFALADLAVGGNDVIGRLVAKGLAPANFGGDGRVGEALRWLFEQVTDRPERNDRETLLALLDDYFDRGGAPHQT